MIIRCLDPQGPGSTYSFVVEAMRQHGAFKGLYIGRRVPSWDRVPTPYLVMI